jgi:hypothetical protein
VVPEAAAVDIDALGVDLGLESPIVALQVKNSDADWFVTYKIYSLENCHPHAFRPPRVRHHSALKTLGLGVGVTSYLSRDSALMLLVLSLAVPAGKC